MGHFVTDKHLCADVMLPDFVVEPVLLRHVGLCLAMKDVGTPLGLHLVDRREQVIRVMSEPTRSHEQYALLPKRACKAAYRLAKRASARKRANGRLKAADEDGAARIGVDAAQKPLERLGKAVIHVTRSEERRVGKECVRTCRSRWSTYQ